tara:strand:+ start:770 stop:1066 length:297 start_codon:yes stop_codon:yes gene_type:complete
MAGNEVISVHINASGSLANCNGRLKGFITNHKTGASGDIIIYDNASAASGDVVMEVDETVAGAIAFDIPGDGIMFHNGLYASLPANTSLTVFIQLGGR